MHLSLNVPFYQKYPWHLLLSRTFTKPPKAIPPPPPPPPPQKTKASRTLTGKPEKMTKFWLEITLISARGLRRVVPLFKLQSFAVGWIHSDRKYITKIDGIGDTHPVWNTKFTALIDSSESDPNALMLNVEVYTRDPFFLTEKLHGSASVPLKEFFAKYLAKINEDHENIGFEVFEVGSFQLRKRGSDKPKGFVDVSIRISDEKDQGFGDRGEDEPMAAYPAPVNQPINYPPSNFPYNPPPNLPQSFTNPRPPPPNLGYFPNSNGLPPRPPPPNLEYYPNPNGLPENYIPLPSHTQGGLRPGFGMGIGAGAVAGGVISSNDLLPDMNFPTNLHGGSLTISGNSFF
ncbi:hypothetical protein AMTRI_Chr08g210280 [Amborella trichopoda]